MPSPQRPEVLSRARLSGTSVLMWNRPTIGLDTLDWTRVRNHVWPVPDLLVEVNGSSRGPPQFIGDAHTLLQTQRLLNWTCNVGPTHGPAGQHRGIGSE